MGNDCRDILEALFTMDKWVFATDKVAYWVALIFMHAHTHGLSCEIGENEFSVPNNERIHSLPSRTIMERPSMSM